MNCKIKIGYYTQGFSLLELIVVIAIVAILAAVSSVTYKTYKMRVEMDKLIVHSQLITDKIREYYNRKGSIPATPADLGMGGTSNLISSSYWPNVSFINSVRLIGNSPSDFSCYAGCIGTNCSTLIYDFDEAILGFSTKMELWFNISENNGIITTKCGLHQDTYNDAKTRELFPAACQQIAYTC